MGGRYDLRHHRHRRRGQRVGRVLEAEGWSVLRWEGNEEFSGSFEAPAMGAGALHGNGIETYNMYSIFH